MLAYTLKRILSVVPVLVLVSLFVFFLLRLTPGDPAAIIAGDAATPEQLERIREAMGLNEPVVTQYFRWIGKLLRGDFGTSLISNVPVLELVGQRVWPSIALALLTIVIAVCAAIPMGVLAAWKHKSWIDYLVMSFSVLGFSVPVFLVGYVLLLIFSVWLGWLPPQGYKPLSAGLWPFLERAILPALTLASIYIALIARMTRAAMLDVLNEDYIRTARAKGVGDRRLLFVHALKNAAVPIATIVGTGFALLISGVVVTETIFNIPGIGRLTVDAVLARDYPVIQAMILLTATLYVFVNLLIDLSYSLFDPRIRY
ncbi:peptide ABC transporter [Haematobacter missouriensis]|mgnify:CR=1 FL=1|uniref:ABC transporter permease n=1 Tax=Haematobacter missouriensis TaxID=366616 RepID=A0A212AI70_9RHOB|nr:ABC transporter permease [Haematobacter missouriensis]KFI32673.1 peptide ABC transporter [Haematobacter missouriensis]OWJ79096.1 ABC transporter permease [Haematobacter missouriensis]OWJ81149.1 ABC transporter permease [Haematobacter missouriensis]